MKKLLFTFIFLSCINNVMSQHYGGFTFTPYAVENNNSFYKDWRKPIITESKITPGFTIGYQGLIWPNRRFSFSYGLQYSNAYNQATYKTPYYGYNDDHQIISTNVGTRIDLESLQLPLWWRYNILKNKKGFQPFVAISTTVMLPMNFTQTYYFLEKPPIVNDFGQGIKLSLELGIGVNYYTDKWLFTIQPTYSATYVRKIGLGMSVMRKF